MTLKIGAGEYLEFPACSAFKMQSPGKRAANSYKDKVQMDGVVDVTFTDKPLLDVAGSMAYVAPSESLKEDGGENVMVCAISAAALALGDGDALALGEGDALALGDGDALALGDGDALALGDGDALALGEGEGDALALGEGEGDALALGEGEGDALALGEGEGDALALGDGDALVLGSGKAVGVGKEVGVGVCTGLADCEGRGRIVDEGVGVIEDLGITVGEGDCAGFGLSDRNGVVEGLGFGFGNEVGVGEAVRFGFVSGEGFAFNCGVATFTPLLHTSFLPERVQVYLKPLIIEVELTLAQLAPALTTPNAGEKFIETSKKVNESNFAVERTRT